MKILLIEDEWAFRWIFRDALEKESFEVIEAEDGQQGWELAQSAEPDLILLDLILPRLHGFEVLRRIQSDSRTREIPVLLISVLDQAELVKEGLKLGAREFFVKGLHTSHHLLAAVRRLLEKNEKIKKP